MRPTGSAIFFSLRVAYLFLSNFQNKLMKKLQNGDRVPKKAEVNHRNNKLDPNNNKNLPDKPIVKRRGKKMRDDGFEHRTSEETAFLQ
jgi:hypothetical protein